jgi:hypothetical protein
VCEQCWYFPETELQVVFLACDPSNSRMTAFGQLRTPNYVAQLPVPYGNFYLPADELSASHHHEYRRLAKPD